MSEQIIIALITGLLGSGLFTFALGVVQSRRQAPAMHAEVRKLSEDADSTAVTTMKEALAVSHERNETMQETLDFKDRQLLEKDRRINELESRILTLQKQLSGMQATLTAMSVELEALRLLAQKRSEDDGTDAR